MYKKVLAAWSLAIAMGVPATSFAAAPLISPLVSAKSAEAESKALRSAFNIKSKPSPVALSRATVNSLKQDDEHELVFPNATRHVVVFDRIEDHGGGIRSSVGYVKSHGKDYRVIITTGPGGTFGSIRTPETLYRIVPGLDGQDLLVDMTEEQKLIPYIDLGNDVRRAPPPPNLATKNGAEKEVATRLDANAGSPIVALATPIPQATIDLMVVYTNGLAARLGSGLMTRLYNLVTAANTAYVDSEVAITLRLVNATMANYNDTGADGTALDAITPNGGLDAAFTNIETIRTNVGADMVALLRTGSDFGGHGIAWLTTFATPNAGFMYSVTTGCVAGCDSVFIHELGHNMGNAHDKATAAYQWGGDPSPPAGAYPYSFGHFFCASGLLTCNPNLPPGMGGCNTQPRCSASIDSNNNVGTIMSYFNPVTLKFSNPNLQCAPAGGGMVLQPCGVAAQEDNALSMNNMRVALQNIKATVIATPPGAIQFAQSSYSFSETAGTVNIAVSRVGGSSGAVSVSYSTADGSAKAGFDYLPASGMLTWANGDNADKMIAVTIVNDGVPEGGEAFTVSLSNPTGATGIFLGNPSTLSVLLNENAAWPPGGVMPAGFMAIASASGVWDVENTAANCPPGQSPCLRSPMVQSVNQSVFANADLEYTATFPAGTVSFDYRVSSFSTSFGLLEFFIDPAAMNPVPVFSSAGGQTAWLSVSIPISAGAHTLRWRFKDRLDFPCSLLVTGCADRAWLDNVVVPIAVASSSTVLMSSANPSTNGQSVTLTATVTGGAGTPTGVVTFRDAGNIITMPNNCNLVAMVGGMATCTTNALSTGLHTITAAYSGNSTYDVSTSATLMQNVIGMVLTVGKAGTGGGNVVSSPVGIDTAINNNSAGFATNTVVSLTQTPAMGSVFAGWTGACMGTGTCMVTMDMAKSVTATFNAQCSAGTFSMSGLVPCTAASAGSFVASVGATSQTPCSAGNYQPNTGATTCLQASPGSFVANPGSANQSACLIGTYQPNSASTTCLQASPGNFVNMPGATAQSACSPGNYQPAMGASTCLTASPGSFVPLPQATAQTACSPGAYQDVSAQTSCKLAQPGFFVAISGATSPTACPMGTTSIGTGNIACVSILPSAPTTVIATAGNAQAGIAFATPMSDGGSPILDYTATCIGPNTLATVGTSSPIIVTVLTNGQNYSCTVSARNVNGLGPESSPAVNVTPSNVAVLALNGVVSRKNHPGLGDRDLALDTNALLAGLVTVEPRTIGAGHQIVFRFNNAVTSVGGSSTTLGSVSHAINLSNTSEVIATLTGIADNRRATVSLSGVTGVMGTLNPVASVGFLVGDVTNSRSVNVSDISAVKAHNGQATSNANFRFDLNVSGMINGGDVSAVKARSGLVIP